VLYCVSQVCTTLPYLLTFGVNSLKDRLLSAEAKLCTTTCIQSSAVLRDCRFRFTLVAFCVFLLLYHDHFVCVVVMFVCSTCFCAVFIFSASDRKHQHNQFPGKTRLKEDQLCIQRNINSADSHHNTLVLSTCQHTASLTKSLSQI